jgi:hypothetical protein
MDFALACVVKAIVVLMVAMVIIGAARAAMVHRTIQVRIYTVYTFVCTYVLCTI